MTAFDSREKPILRYIKAIPARSLLIGVPVLFLIIFFLLPIGHMVAFSLQTYHPTKLIVPEFTLGNYVAVVTDRYIAGLLLRTITISLATTGVCVVLAFPIAYRMWQAAGTEKMVLSLIVLTPLMISLIVLGYSWVIILAPNNGLVNTILRNLGLPTVKIMFTPFGVVVGLVYSLLVFMVLGLHAALENIDESLIRAARILGAKPVKVFLSVILPLSFPGLVSGSLTVFSISISSFVLPSLLGGRQVPVMATYAYDMANFLNNWPSGSAIAVVLFVLAGSGNLVYSSWIRSVEKRLGILDEDKSR
jgi:putative spermidine/putrescine transport system permease protein